MKIQIPILNIDQLSLAVQQFVLQGGVQRIIAFSGQMGVGKTSFIKVLCEHLGVRDTVNSPTFSIVNQYNITPQLFVYHFDMYRINKVSEVYDFGIEEYLYSEHYCFVEWPEIIEDILPNETLYVHLSLQPDGSRVIAFEL